MGLRINISLKKGGTCIQWFCTKFIGNIAIEMQSAFYIYFPGGEGVILLTSTWPDSKLDAENSVNMWVNIKQQFSFSSLNFLRHK